MITSWTSCTIQDLQNKGEAELKTGPFGTQLHASDYVETGTPVINVRNIGFGEIREEKLEFIAEETVQRLSSHLLEPGDIVFGRKGAVERHAFINPKYARWFQGSDCLRLRVKSPSVDSRFLSYYFLTEHHKQWMINQCSHGATMASLNQAIISRIPLLLPSIHTQRKIISILSAYDDLIENNTRRIEILEEMARSLYREWFVNFRFPGHEQVKMVDSELGLIPEGWEVVKIGDVAEVGRGSSPRPIADQKYFEGGTIPWIKIADATKSGKYLYETKQKVNEYGASFSRLLPKGSLIIAASGTLGYTQLLGVDGCIHDGWLYLTKFKGIEKEYLYYLFREKQQFFYNSAYGAAIQNINTMILRDMKILLPPPQIQKQFKNIISNSDNLLDNLGRKNLNLRQTRDLLLPKLISGEIDVENLDIDTGEIAA